MIKEFQERFTQKLIVAGCILEIYPEKVNPIFKGEKLYSSSIREIPFESKGNKDIWVCSGCIGNCSYCVDKLAVGKFKSRPLEKCLEDIKIGLANNIKSFRIVGDDIGSYGIDIGSNFIELVKSLSLVEDKPFNLRLLEINAKWLVKYLHKLKYLKNSKISDMLIGIQSANNRILKMMKRGYCIEDVSEAISCLRSLNISIGCHFIIGFPSETYEEFQESMDYIINQNFNYGFIFSYSDMEKAASYYFTPKVNDINRRFKIAKKILKSHGFTLKSEGSSKIYFYKL